MVMLTLTTPKITCQGNDVLTIFINTYLFIGRLWDFLGNAQILTFFYHQWIKSDLGYIFWVGPRDYIGLGAST